MAVDIDSQRGLMLHHRNRYIVFYYCTLCRLSYYRLLSNFVQKYTFFSDIYKKCTYIILQKCFFLSEEAPRMALRVLRPKSPHFED